PHGTGFRVRDVGSADRRRRVRGPPTPDDVGRGPQGECCPPLARPDVSSTPMLSGRASYGGLLARSRAALPPSPRPDSCLAATRQSCDTDSPRLPTRRLAHPEHQGRRRGDERHASGQRAARAGAKRTIAMLERGLNRHLDAIIELLGGDPATARTREAKIALYAEMFREFRTR